LELFWKLYEADSHLVKQTLKSYWVKQKELKQLKSLRVKQEGVEAVQVPLGEEQGEVQLGEEI
jgi:hypothetical protein